MGAPRDASIMILAIPEADRAVGAHRWRHDTSAAVVLPAHITLAHPFKPPHLLGPDDLDLLHRIGARTAPFTVRLGSTGRFGNDVLFLQPDDPAPVVRLMRSIEAAFPDHPLHGGAFPDPHPHVTIASRHDDPHFDAITARVSPHLPVLHEATGMELWTGPAFGSGAPGWSLEQCCRFDA